MQRLAVLLRGVNVGGAGTRLPMAEFRAVLESIGCVNVATYIQSGNAALRSALAPDDLAAAIRAAIRLPNGAHPAVFVLTADQVARALAENPFPAAEAQPKSLHLVFSDAGSAPDADGLMALATGREAVVFSGGVLYLYTPDGFGTSRMAERLPRHLGGAAHTARNLATMRALAAMIEALPGG